MKFRWYGINFGIYEAGHKIKFETVKILKYRIKIKKYIFF